MTFLISPELNKKLCDQLVKEKYNANLYLYIAGFLRNKGLNNLANHFLNQHDEETNHAKMFFDLLTDLNSEVKIPGIPGCTTQINTILDIAKLYVEREINTTNSINDIKNFSIEDKNPIVEEFCRKMIVLQQNEYQEAIDFQDKASMTGGDWKFVLMWDGNI